MEASSDSGYQGGGDWWGLGGPEVLKFNLLLELNRFNPNLDNFKTSRLKSNFNSESSLALINKLTLLDTFI